MMTQADPKFYRWCMKQTVCFLSSAHPPRDKRVFDKEAVSLARAGYTVIHLAPDVSPGLANRPVVERGVRLAVYPRPSGLLGRALQLPRLYRLARQQDADCFHCNEVDSWLVGALLKLFHRKRLVFDVHEHYPSTFSEGRFPVLLRPIVAGWVRLVFRVLSCFTDRLVLAKRTVGSDFQRSRPSKILVQNFPLLSSLSSSHTALGVRSGEAGSAARVQAIHLGLFSRPRGWPQLLQAMSRMKVPGLELRVIGAFNDGSEASFHQTAGELQLSERIQVRPWLPFDEAFQQILRAQIGLVLFQPGTTNHVMALPHKMFDYMMAALPVVIPAFAREIAQIVVEEQCGLLVDPQDPDQIAETLDVLAGDAQLRRRLGDNGRRAVMEKYNWETEERKLLNMYAELLAEAG